MNFLFKVLTLSFFVLLLPVMVYSVISNLIKKDTSTFASEYDFIASAEVPGVGAEGEGSSAEGSSAEGSCEGAASQGCEGAAGGEGGEGGK